MNAQVLHMHKNPRLTAALSYVSLGWHILPAWWIQDGKCACGSEACKSPGKHPIARIAPWGQKSSTTDADTVRRWWEQYPQANIAAFLEPSNLCAIDIDPRNGGLDTIDQIEAKHGKLDSDLLQFTGGGGEHRVFQKPATGNLPGKLGPGVDVKLNGYIMLEPSNHVSGKQYAWEASSDPRDGILPSPLPDWLRDLAAQRISAPPVAGPSEGRVLHITEAQQREIEEALSAIPADDRDTWLQVGMALKSTSDYQWAYDVWCKWSEQSTKFDPVDQLRVWRSIASKGLDGITYRSIFEMAKRNGVVVLPVPTMNIEPAPMDEIKIVHDKMPEVPPHLLLPPNGVLREVVQWINATSPKPQPLFAVQTALAFASTVLGRRFSSDNENFTSLYFLNIGESGSGKEYAKTAIEKLLTSCELTHLIGPSGYTSNAGVLSCLLHQPNHVAVIDEFHRLLELASLKNNGNLKSMLTYLMTAWGQLHSVVRPVSYSTLGLSSKDAQTAKERTVYNPAITTVALAIPDFWEKVGSAAVRDGFLNRFLIVESEIGRQVSNFSAKTPVPQSVIDWAKSVRSRYSGVVDPDTCGTMGVEPVIVGMSDGARRAFMRFEESCMTGEVCKIAADAQVVEIVNRSNEIAMRLALILALSRDGHQIEEADAQWAIEYVRCHAMRSIYRLKHCVADSEFAAVSKQVYSILARRGQPMTMARIIDFCPRLNNYNVQQRSHILSALVEAGKVAIVEKPGGHQGRGRKAPWFVAVDSKAEDWTDE